MSVNMTARAMSTLPFEGIQIDSVEVQCMGEHQWEAKLRIRGEQLPIPCGNHHASKSDAIEEALNAALNYVRQQNELKFESWICLTRKELNSDKG